MARSHFDDNAEPHLLERFEQPARELMANHPPVWRNDNKRVLAELSCPPGASHEGIVHYSRWRPPERRPRQCPLDLSEDVTLQADVYDYRAAVLPERLRAARPAAPVVEWHVNFADPVLFVAYGSGLFAQDEMQVAEHPVLGALVEALTAAGFDTVTRDGTGPSPVLIRGVQRRCRVATDPNPATGRPNGLYGNRFRRADPAVIRTATTVIDPPTITNLIAIAAPAGGDGLYRRSEIDLVFDTAYTGFRAACLESLAACLPGAKTGESSGDGSAAAPIVVLHTGFWGCGAFGGNRWLMVLLQILAARTAGVDQIVFHTFDASGVQDVADAIDWWDNWFENQRAVGADMPTEDLLRSLEVAGFEWGLSDGN